MNFFDFHVDTLSRLYLHGKDGEDLFNNGGHIDIKRLAASNYSAQMFACYFNLGGTPKSESNYGDVLGMIDLFKSQAEKYSDIFAQAYTYADYEKNKSEGKVTGILTVEEGGVLEGDLSRLDELYEKGVRAITLTWNYENCIGYPNFKMIHQNDGLKPFGIEALEKMNELGIIPDVSHLSDGGFYDVYKYSKKPFMATHSNARAVTNHGRNLTDDMIKKLAEKGGITGLNFCASFLSEDSQSTTENMLKHVRHIINVGGLEVMGLGTDFDGIDDNLELKGAQDMPKLVEAMEKAKFTSGEIEAICYKNAENFMKRCLK